MDDLSHAVAYNDLAEYLDYMDAEGKSPRTIYNYTRQLGALLREHPETTFADLTPAQITSTLVGTPLRSRYITYSVFKRCSSGVWCRASSTAARCRRCPKSEHPKREPIEVYTEAEIALLELLLQPTGCSARCCSRRDPQGRGAQPARDRIDRDRERMVVTEKSEKKRIIPLLPEALKAIADLVPAGGAEPRTRTSQHSEAGRPHPPPQPDRLFDDQPLVADLLHPHRVPRSTGCTAPRAHLPEHGFGRSDQGGVESRQLLLGRSEDTTTTVTRRGYVSSCERAADVLHTASRLLRKPGGRPTSRRARTDKGRRESRPTESGSDSATVDDMGETSRKRTVGCGQRSERLSSRVASLGCLRDLHAKQGAISSQILGLVP